jgi:hypothetical protein
MVHIVNDRRKEHGNACWGQRAMIFDICAWWLVLWHDTCRRATDLIQFGCLVTRELVVCGRRFVLALSLSGLRWCGCNRCCLFSYLQNILLLLHVIF